MLLFHPKNSFLCLQYFILTAYKNFFSTCFNLVENNKHHTKKKWSYIPDHPYKILLIGGSGSGKTNVLLNFTKEQDSNNAIDKIFLYAKDEMK